MTCWQEFFARSAAGKGRWPLAVRRLAEPLVSTGPLGERPQTVHAAIGGDLRADVDRAAGCWGRSRWVCRPVARFTTMVVQGQGGSSRPVTLGRHTAITKITRLTLAVSARSDAAFLCCRWPTFATGCRALVKRRCMGPQDAGDLVFLGRVGFESENPIKFDPFGSGNPACVDGLQGAGRRWQTGPLCNSGVGVSATGSSGGLRGYFVLGGGDVLAIGIGAHAMYFQGCAGISGSTGRSQPRRVLGLGYFGRFVGVFYPAAHAGLRLRVGQNVPGRG